MDGDVLFIPQVVIAGTIQSVYGTSCSAPVFAAMGESLSSQLQFFHYYTHRYCACRHVIVAVLSDNVNSITITLLPPLSQSPQSSQSPPLSPIDSSYHLHHKLVTLVNSQRLLHNMSSIGFVNPSIYAAGTGYFNDITSGHNKCCAYSGVDPMQATCCNSGFTAASGWDPVTGTLRACTLYITGMLVLVVVVLADESWIENI